MLLIQSQENREDRIHYEVNPEMPPIGVGGMGQVFAGVMVNELSGRRRNVAIKFLFDDLPENILERARREASIRIQNENLVEMIDFVQIDENLSDGRTRPHYHVVSELLEGIMLHDLLNGKTTNTRGEEVDMARAMYLRSKSDRIGFSISIVKNLLSGVMALHDKGFIHRDIDPSNIMVCFDGKIKLIDFGIAKQLTTLSNTDQHLTVVGKFMGKASYAAPELVMGDIHHQNATTDIYAIGIVFFQLLTGRLPFEGASHEILDKQLHEKLPLKMIDNKSLRKIIEKATAKSQADRFQSAAEFRVALERFEKSAASKSAVQKAVSATPAPGASSRAVKPPKPQKPKKVRKKIDWKGVWAKSKQYVYYGCAACAVCVALIYSGKALKSHHEAKEAAARAEEVRKQEEKIKRIAELQVEVFDSSDPSAFKIDSLTQFKIPSAGAIIAKADSLYSIGSIEAVDSAIVLYNRVADKKYKSSAIAVLKLGSIYFDKGEKEAAHQANLAAYQLDSTDYHILYELGEDYFIGVSRTGEERSMDEAEKYYTSGLRYAEACGDSVYAGKFAARLERFQVRKNNTSKSIGVHSKNGSAESQYIDNNFLF